MRNFTIKPLVLAMAVAAVPAVSQAQDGQILEEVIVTGSYAASLRDALNVKREATGIVDSVFAEDLGKFPDQNLADSLGRIPGVSVEQDDGEGRTITVRGLGSTFTAVTVNGMPAQSLAAGSGGVRSNRAFDFNVFASELFTRLDVHKSTSGELEDGSLGATVGLRTARPFDYDEFTAAVNVEAGYYEASDNISPRLSGLVSFSNDTVGFLASLAYSQKETPVTGPETGRWNRQSGANQFLCTDCTADQLAELNTSYHPRFPRYADKTNDQDRLGLTASFQWQIADATLLNIDGLYSKIEATRQEPFMQAISFARNDATGMREMNVQPGFEIGANNTLVYAVVEDADIRTEAFEANWESEYTQLSAELTHEFSDRFRMNVLAGVTKSEMDNREITLVYEHFNQDDPRRYVDYAQSNSTVTYDLSNMKRPTISYGFDTTNPANWEFGEYRDRVYDASAETDMFRIDFAYDLADGFTAKAGVTNKSYSFDLAGKRADRSFADADQFDSDDGETANGNACGITPNLTSADGSAISAGGQSFFYPDFSLHGQFLESGCWEYAVQAGDTRKVKEEVLSFFAQLDIDIEVLGNRLRGNIGIRKSDTDLTSTGVTAADGVPTQVVVKNDYSDTLPSLNLAYNLTDDLVLRFAAAEVLARPELSDLNPGGSVTIFGTSPSIRYGNPLIDPYRAKSYDLGLEWYYADDALAGLTFFQKDVESFPTSETTHIPWSETGLPDSLLGGQTQLRDEIFEVNRRVNGGGGDIQGFELAWQQQLSFLPGPDWVRGFGVQANYTHVSKAEFGDGRAMTNVSEDSYNLTVYWEGEKFQARITNAFRGEYYSNINTNNPWQNRIVDDSNIVGISASYDINDQLRLTFKGVNIFDEPLYEYEDEEAKRIVKDFYTGASYFLGASYRF